MPLTAEYRSPCSDCGFDIDPGTPIERDEYGWRHTQCPDDQADPTELPCTDCHLIHAGPCT